MKMRATKKTLGILANRLDISVALVAIWLAVWAGLAAELIRSLAS
jgi:hypothetical protein